MKTPKSFSNNDEIDHLVQDYQESSGFKIVIRRSWGGARTYYCASHVRCCFRAKFGKVRGTDFLALKETTYAFHCGEAVLAAKDGRALKGRIKSRVMPFVDSVASVKYELPTPRDVMKAAASLGGYTATYQQSFRAIQSTKSGDLENNKKSFELIIPYLQRFVELNQGSTTTTERDSGNFVQRLFVCPSIMHEAVKFVRPVMSLDAAHLKSQWKGILYVASVKSACDEIFPVAFAITGQNENESGWKWFLQLLSSSLPVLTMDHPKDGVAYKQFTFISDRQKGLVKALEQVFPENHSCHCAIHIARNVERKFGKSIAKYVLPLARTFSPLVSQQLLSEFTVAARNYLEKNPASHWRNSAWLEDPSLPPRYGVLTSNMSESANAMFEKARDCSWLYCIHTILSKMVERIVYLRDRHEGKTGVLEKVTAEFEKKWMNCAGFKVVRLEKEGHVFAISPQRGTTSDSEINCNLDVVNCNCDCGEWQNHGVPCIHAVAYFRLYKRMTLEQMKAEQVAGYYTYEKEMMLLDRNIVPVCMQRIRHDGATLPPRASGKRSTGRPQKVRIRKRSRWAHEPERSNIVCSRCLKRGHNIRTCLMRETLDSKGNDVDNIQELLDLS
jgi:hypothetical protein